MCNCNPTSSTSSGSGSVIPVGGSCGTCQDGASSYTYIRFADTVVNQGLPAYTVTGFSTTAQPTTQWLGIITTNNPITPTSANFNTYWVQIAGPGAGGGVGVVEVEENNSLIVSGASILNFFATDLTGVTVTDAGGGQADIEIATSAFRKITLANAQAAILASTLKAGTTYWIYDVGDGLGHTNAATAYSGIILRASSTNSFDPTGIFIARNINRTAVPVLWNYSTSYNLGDYVENFNEVYQAAIGGTTSTLNPAANLAEWNYIDKSNATYYTTEIQRCVYDVATNMILQRADVRGNTITTYNSSSASNNAITLKCFRWGYAGFLNNKININLASITSNLSGRMPLQQNFKWNAISGTITNNIVEILYSSNFYVQDINTSAATTVTNVFITNNTLRNCRIAFSTNMNMVSNDLSESRIEGNVYVSSVNQHIYNNKGSFEILNNTSNTGYAGNDGTAPIKDTEIINCVGLPNTALTSTSNRIESNIGCLIQNSELRQSLISSNANLFIYTCILSGLSEISNNITDGRNDSRRFISQANLKAEARISYNTFTGFTSLGPTYSQKIIYTNLLNRYSYIVSVNFNPTTYSVTLDNTVYTLATSNLVGTTLDNVHFDGNNVTGASANSGVRCIQQAVVPAFISTQLNASYSTVSANNASNNAYAFINVETDYVAGTGTLTIPYTCLHAKTFILYNVPNGGITISKVVIDIAWTGSILGITVPQSYVGPWKFINGSGVSTGGANTKTVTFTLTAVGSIATDNIVRTNASSSVVLTRPTDVVEITKQSNYYTVNNVQIVS